MQPKLQFTTADNENLFDRLSCFSLTNGFGPLVQFAVKVCQVSFSGQEVCFGVVGVMCLAGEYREWLC